MKNASVFLFNDAAKFAISYCSLSFAAPILE
jgi:hypothetical protein